MSLVDSAALWTNRLGANAPQISTLGFSRAYSYGLSLLSAFEDGQYLLAQSAPSISVLTASGSALDLLGANAAVFRGLGTAAALLVQFSVQTMVAGSAVVINAGNLVATPGDNVSVIQQTYTTQSVATISVGATASNLVLAVANTPGTAANVAAGSIILMQTALAGVQVTNNPGGNVVPTSYTTPDANGQILGSDPELDGQFRQRILAALALKYGTTAQALAIQAVSMPEQLTPLGDTAKHNYQPWDAYVYDPQNGSGFIYYAWALADGSAPGLPGGATTSTADGVTYVNLGATVLTDFALAVDAAVRAVSPGNVVPRIFAAGSVTSPFNVVAVTAITAKVTVPATVILNTSTFADATSTIIKQAVIAYIQSLLHNAPPTVVGAAQFVIAYCAGFSIPITNFALQTVNGTNVTSSPLSAGTVVAPILYRCTASTSAVTLSIGYV